MQPSKLCPGKYRVNHGRWYTPSGKSVKECTYCEWCVTNGCVDPAEGYTINDNLLRCLCDCPVKETHQSAVPHTCLTHWNQLHTPVLGTCRKCRRPDSTRCSTIQYCDDCSVSFGICTVCGVDANGHFPFRVVTKMLSAENGRNCT